MDARPIGVFDSGLGGLTAVKELSRILPEENIVYFGDTGRVPYGSRSREILRKYTRQDINFLLSQNVKMILAACGTVSSTAPDILQSVGVPATGVIFPTAQAAASATRNGRSASSAPPRRSAAAPTAGSWKRSIRPVRLRKGLPAVCPFGGERVCGRQRRDHPAHRAAVPFRPAGERRRYADHGLHPLSDHQPDHSKVMGGGVTLIDSGRETALWAARALRESGLLAEGGGERSFFVSDYVENFCPDCGNFPGLQYPFGRSENRH